MNNENKLEIENKQESFIDKLSSEQVNLPKQYTEVLEKIFWDLLI